MQPFKLFAFFVIGTFIQQHSAYNQSLISGIPESYKNKNIQINETIFMPGIDSIGIIAQELSWKRNNLKSNKVAQNFNVSISPSNNGSWQDFNGKRIWTLKIKSKGALAIGLVMRNILLKNGEKLFIYNNYDILGAFTNSNSQNIMTFQPLQGDELTIEFSSNQKKGMEGNFIIESVAHFYKSALNYGNPIAGSCNFDINCPVGNNWQVEKHAVCLLYNGTLECTGTLVNNTSQDSKPYILTADHCFYGGQYDVDRTIIFFNFESQSCNGNGDKLFLGTVKQVLYGGKLVAASYDHDFALIELNQHPPMEVKPYYAGWDLNSTSNFDTLACIHHPQWSVKKISLAYTSPVTGTYTDDQLAGAANAFWIVPKWSVGVTEGGSSGSTLFNQSHRIIGTLTGGASACDSLTGSDYYEKFSESFQHYSDTTQQLKHWLDPINSGISSLDGYKPFSESFLNCDTLSNIETGERTDVIPFEFGKGYYSGHNSDSITDYAEKFSNLDSAYLTGVNFHINRIGSIGGLIISVFKSKLDTSDIIYETYVPYSRLKGNALNYIEFYPYQKIQGNFYISYKITYLGTDTFNMYQAFPRYNSTNNSIYLNYKNRWTPLDSLTLSNWGSALDIRPNLCFIKYTKINNVSINYNFSVYPCPASNYIKLNLPTSFPMSKLEVIDLYGRTLINNRNISNFELNISDLPEGIYFVKVFTGNRTYSAKFVKTK